MSGAVFSRCNKRTGGKEADIIAKHKEGEILGLSKIDSGTTKNSDVWNLAAGAVEIIEMEEEDLLRLWKL